MAVNGNSATLTFATNSFFSDGFILGMKSFNVNGPIKLEFSTLISSTTTVTSTIAFTYLKFSYWSLKKRFCPNTIPYFDRVL